MTFSPRISQLRVKHITLLELIAATGSLRRAADSMHVTQPAVTAMLHELESAFAAPLVERDRRGARLTTAGEALRERLTLVSHELADAADRMNAAATRPYLRVGVLPVALLQLVPAAAARLRLQDHPMSLKLVDGTVAGLADKLLAGELDCVLGRIDLSTLERRRAAELSAEVIMKMTLQVAVSANSRLARAPKGPIRLASLQQREWVLPERGSETRGAFDQGFLQRGLTPPGPSIEALTFFSSFELVARTDLLTIAPAIAVRHYERLGLVKALPLRWPVPLSPLSFIRRAGSVATSGLEVFRRVVLEVARAEGVR